MYVNGQCERGVIGRTFFSISIPVHNAERYLNRCIGLIISQTEGNYELILMDDGSQDSSLDVCI